MEKKCEDKKSNRNTQIQVHKDHLGDPSLGGDLPPIRPGKTKGCFKAPLHKYHKIVIKITRSEKKTMTTVFACSLINQNWIL